MKCDDIPYHDVRTFVCHWKRSRMWRIDALLLLNIVTVAVMVGIGAYGRRYRHRPIIRFLFGGANSVFLPIMSSVISASGSNSLAAEDGSVMASCHADFSRRQIILWTCLVHIVATNTSVIVAGDDREDRNIDPPVVLLIRVIWTSYLLFSSTQNVPATEIFYLYPPFVIVFAKMILKFYAFYKARRSYALGRNPRLAVGYMEQLSNGSQQGEHAPPPLLVTGEETVHAEKQPHGYCFDHDSATGMNNMLVTIDKVWQLGDVLPGATTRLKDLCLSIALFKLLRCRFARYTIAEAGFHKVLKFFWHELIMDGDGERVLGVIKDELCLLYDYYYSSLSISYPNRWLPILNICISLFSIIYCLLTLGYLLLTLGHLYIVTPQGWKYSYLKRSREICQVFYNHIRTGQDSRCDYTTYHDVYFGRISFLLVPVCLLLALVVLTEVREIASYMYSNWTKVALICRYTSQQSSSCMSRIL